jgi:hypothetical protein
MTERFEEVTVSVRCVPYCILVSNNAGEEIQTKTPKILVIFKVHVKQSVQYLKFETQLFFYLMSYLGLFCIVGGEEVSNL